MQTEKVFDLWYNEEFRAEIKNRCRDACRDCPGEYKNFVAHVWSTVSLLPPDMLMSYYNDMVDRAISKEKESQHEEKWDTP